MYQQRRSYQGRNTSFNPLGNRNGPRKLRLFNVGQVVQVTDLKPEPSVMDYHKRQRWLTANYFGSVISSTENELVLLNLRTGKNSYVHYSSGYTLNQYTEEQYLEHVKCQERLRKL